jgi:hypothetical protein
MNIQLKSYLIIIITLVIGVVIGGMSHRAMQRHGMYGPGRMCPPGMDCPPGSDCPPGMKNCPKHRKGPRGDKMGMGKFGDMEKHGEIIKKKFKYHLEPTAEQWTKIEPLLDNHIKVFSARMKEQKQKIQDMKDSIKKDLEPFLTPEQIKSLEKMKNRRGRKGHFCKPGSKKGF